MTVFYQITEEEIQILGNTYIHKDMIKTLGGRFKGEKKIWTLPVSDLNREKIHEFCLAQGGGQLKGATVIVKDPGPQLTSTLSTPILSAQTQTENSPLFELGKELITLDPKIPTAVQAWSVSRLVQEVQQHIQRAFPESIWLLGEVQNVSIRNGHIYFALAERDTSGSQGATVTVSGSVWAQVVSSLTKKYPSFKPQDLFQEGLQVQLLCQVGFYKNRGQIWLNVLDVDPNYTKGALALARENLLRELRAKNLHKANASRPVAALPLKVGLLTAPDSRAYSDFVHQLFSGGYAGEIVFIPCSMQGERVSDDLVGGLKKLQKEKVDLIVITRGGGSAADLRWFDTAEVAYAVAQCPVPILAAIGHHDDVCVVEEIAWKRQKTPTAAADQILEIFQNIKEILGQWSYQLITLANRQVDDQKREVLYSEQRINSAWVQILSQCELRIQGLTHQILSLSGEQINKNMEALSHLWATLNALDPTPWIEKGWTQLSDGTQHIMSVKECKPGDMVKLRLVDGIIRAEIKECLEL